MNVDTKLKSGNYSESLNLTVCNLVPEKTVCLDVGCWDGNMGEFLTSEKNCIVDGIDVNSSMLAKASLRGYRNTFNINLNAECYDLSSLPNDYDVLLFADVLEHLVNPLELLRGLIPHLKNNGSVIVSLPNVAFIQNRLKLLFGSWDYTEFGTLDKTHLKFFTLKTARMLLEDAGYEVEDVYEYNQFKRLQIFNSFLKFFPGVLGYQIIVKAKKHE